MTKKRLIKEMEIIIAKNDKLYSKCRDLESLLTEREEEILRLKSELDDLKRELADRSIASTDCTKTEEINDVSPESDIIAADESMCEKIETEPSDNGVGECNECKVVLEEKSKVPENFALSAISASIGRVVIKCAKLCNTFADTGDPNSKDLINLALGRTEVFKSEVLALATADMTEERLNAELKLKESETNEYFELLLHQI